jgi:uncharacterized protein YjgD (DUF1641 family)
MDVKKFQDSRNAELDSFKKQYQFLKSEYSDALSSAIKETDSAQQQTLISRVQQINGQLAEELHGIINVLNKGSKGFDSKELDDLTADLITYQKEYAEIEKSKDKVSTLKLIRDSTGNTLKNAMVMYYIYIAILVALSFYVGYLVLKTTWAQTFSKMFTTVTRRS